MRADDARRERFETIAAVVYEPLQRYLKRRTDPDNAADALADTLLVIWRRLDEVPPEAVPWTLGVARRCLANQRRSAGRRLRLVRRAASHVRDAAGGDPQDEIERRDPELQAALRTLTDAEAEVVRLWAWERLEPREIAEVVGLTPNAVSVALSRAKRKLADQLDQLDRQKQRDAGHYGGTGTNKREETTDG